MTRTTDPKSLYKTAHRALRNGMHIGVERFHERRPYSFVTSRLLDAAGLPYFDAAYPVARRLQDVNRHNDLLECTDIHDRLAWRREEHSPGAMLED